MYNFNRYRGIILTPLLIFIALVSMIAGTVAVLNRGVFAWDSGESRGQLNAATLKKQAADLKSGFNQAVASGIESGQITLDEGSKGLYNPSFGFAIKPSIPASACAVASCEWQINTTLKISDIVGSSSSSSSSSGSSSGSSTPTTEGCVQNNGVFTYFVLAQTKEPKDIVFLAPGLNASACEQLIKQETPSTVTNGKGSSVPTSPIVFIPGTTSGSTPGANSGGSEFGGQSPGLGIPSSIVVEKQPTRDLPSSIATAIDNSPGQGLWFKAADISSLFSQPMGVLVDKATNSLITIFFKSGAVYYSVLDAHVIQASTSGTPEEYLLIKNTGNNYSLPLRNLPEDSPNLAQSTVWDNYEKYEALTEDVSCTVPSSNFSVENPSAELDPSLASLINNSPGKALWFNFRDAESFLGPAMGMLVDNPTNTYSTGIFREGNTFYTWMDVHIVTSNQVTEGYMLIKRTDQACSAPLRKLETEVYNSTSSVWNSYQKHVGTNFTYCQAGAIKWGAGCEHEGGSELNNKPPGYSIYVYNNIFSNEGGATITCHSSGQWAVSNASCTYVPPPAPNPEPESKNDGGSTLAWYGAGGGPFSDTSACVSAAIADLRAQMPDYRDVQQKMGAGSSTETTFTAVIQARMPMSLDWHEYSYNFVKR